MKKNSMILSEGIPFQLVQMSQISNFLFNSSNFASNFFFLVRFPPLASNRESKNKLKFPCKKKD